MNKQSKYNPDQMEDFARETLGLSDPVKIYQINEAYRQWYFDRERSLVHVNPDPKPDEVDLCFLVRIGGTDAKPYNVYASLNESTGVFVLRKQSVHNERLQSMTPIEVATLTQGSNFGYSEEGRNHGQYMHRGSNSMYSESAFSHLKDITYESGRSSGEDLIRSIARIAGHWDQERDYFQDHEAHYDLYDHIRKHALAVERDVIRKGFKEFLSHLDPNALKVLARSRMPNAFYYSWLVGRSDRGHGDKGEVVSPEAIRNRQEAAYAFPIFLSAMVYSGKFTDMIDAGGPLIETVQRFTSKEATEWGEDEFKVPRETVKWFLGKKPYLVDGFHCSVNPRIYHIASDVEWISALPREWRPRGDQEYRSYDWLFSNMSDYATLTDRPKTELFRELVSALNKPGGLPKFEEKATNENGNETDEKPTLKSMFEVARPIQAMIVANIGDDNSRFSLDSNEKDFLRRVGEQIIFPELYCRLANAGVSINKLFQDEKDWHDCDPLDYRSKAGQLSKPIFQGLSVIKVMTSSLRWHKHAARLEDRTGHIERDMTWHPIVEPTIAPNGIRISALSSTQQLRDMGHTMNNCVGGYSYHCAVKNSHVLTLSAEDGSWTTNLEIRDSGNGTRSVSEVQHEMPANKKAVPVAATQAATWLIESINNGEIECNWETIDEIRAEHQKDAVLMKIGFDPLSLEARERAYKAWHGAMPDLFPQADRTIFLEELGISGAMDKIVAEYVQATEQDRKPSLDHN